MQQILDQCNQKLAKLQSAVEEVAPPPEIREQAQKYVDRAYMLFEKKHGISLNELMNKTLEKLKQEYAMGGAPDPNSPIFKAADELKAKIEKSRQDAVALIKKAVGTPDAELVQKRKAACLDAVYAYIVAPTAENAQILMQLGNQCPDAEEGLLSLIGFWSFGDLAPMQELVIKTPPGLMSNGLSALLLKCALHDGGTKSFDERYKTYYELGYEIALGKNSWSDSVHSGISKHEELKQKLALSQDVQSSDPNGPKSRRFKGYEK